MSRRLPGQEAGSVFMREAAVNCQHDSPLAPDGVESITLYSFHLARRGLYCTTFSPNKYQRVCVVSVRASRRGMATVLCILLLHPPLQCRLFLPSQG